MKKISLKNLVFHQNQKVILAGFDDKTIITLDGDMNCLHRWHRENKGGWIKEDTLDSPNYRLRDQPYDLLYAKAYEMIEKMIA